MFDHYAVQRSSRKFVFTAIRFCFLINKMMVTCIVRRCKVMRVRGKIGCRLVIINRERSKRLENG